MIRWRLSRFGVILAIMLGLRVTAFGASPTAPGQGSDTPPPLPPPRSPVDTFRDLLAMTSAERAASLARRSPEVQTRLQAKIQEYELMPPELRELRLRATELRWYLAPLMRLPAAKRPPLASAVPQDLQQLVADRLQHWDLMSPDAQRELLENERVLDYFTQAQAPNTEQQKRLLDSLPQARREELEADFARWQAMPTAARQQLAERVNHFFDLTSVEQERTLATLSEPERRQMEKTLTAFERMPREQRIQCVRSFAKLAGMSAVERQQFLKNAARWSEMSPSERQAWRDIVHRLPEMPPLPPGFGLAPRPPLPPPLLPPGHAPAMSTNGG